MQVTNNKNNNDNNKKNRQKDRRAEADGGDARVGTDKEEQHKMERTAIRLAPKQNRATTTIPVSLLLRLGSGQSLDW